MVQRPRYVWSVVAVIALAILFSTSTGLAQSQPPPGDSAKPSEPTPSAKTTATKQCLSTFSATQRLRREGKLLQAEQNAISCAQQSCPEVTRAHCVKWLEQLRNAIPSIVVIAKTNTGQQLTDASVSVDGKQVAGSLDGRPIHLDPGPRMVTLIVGAESFEQKLIVVQGQKSRTVEFTVPQKGATSTEPSPTGQPTTGGPAAEGGVSPLVWVGFAVAGAGIVVGAITGGISLGKARELEDKCVNNGCLPSEHETLSEAKTLAHVSTTSFIVAGVGAVLGVAGLFLGTAPADEPTTPSGVSFRPLLGVGYAGVQGRF